MNLIKIYEIAYITLHTGFQVATHKHSEMQCWQLNTYKKGTLSTMSELSQPCKSPSKSKGNKLYIFVSGNHDMTFGLNTSQNGRMN